MEFDLNFSSIYIHWPFCPYRCFFCPFVTVIGKDEYMERYNNALNTEIENFKSEKQQKIKTIYVGGGTPSTWPEKLLLDTFGTLNKTFNLSELEEFCLEVNPGTASRAKLEAWKQIGINRLSIGVQGLNDNVLKSLGRNQSREDVVNLLNMASEYFENISIDLILGLPDTSEADWQAFVAEVVTWNIRHISVYFLTVHEGTKLYFGLRKGQISLPREESYIRMYDWTTGFLKKHGFMQYEVSSFAKEGYQSKHNQVYWSRGSFKGFGIGACSFDGHGRFQNEKNILKYMEGIEEGKDVTIFSEKLTKNQEWIEVLMLGIRQTKGLSMDKLKPFLSEKEMEIFLEKVKSLQEANLLRKDKDKIYLTQLGLGMENEVVLRLIK